MCWPHGLNCLKEPKIFQRTERENKRVMKVIKEKTKDWGKITNHDPNREKIFFLLPKVLRYLYRYYLGIIL